MVQPPLTEADRRSMAAQATQNRRRPEQHVKVTFDGHPETEDRFFDRADASRPLGSPPGSPLPDPAVRVDGS
jgi:hypothetical protein